MGNNVIDVNFNEQKECLPLIFKSVGPRGGDGKSAYEQAIGGGYKGTEAEFTDDLGKIHEVSNCLQEVEEAKEVVIESAASAAESAASAAESAASAAESAASAAASSASFADMLLLPILKTKLQTV